MDQSVHNGGGSFVPARCGAWMLDHDRSISQVISSQSQPEAPGQAFDSPELNPARLATNWDRKKKWQRVEG